MAHILIIDDEHNIRLMMRRTVEAVGHTADTASDGPEGLHKFGNGSGWDVVLLDQRMPEMEGLEVLRQMRGRDPDAKIIMVTAFGTIDLAVEAMKAGATEFLRKPFTTEMLRGAVQAALGTDRSGQGGDPSNAVTYGMTTINGYRIESVPGSGVRDGGSLVYAFSVHSPADEAQTCAVHLPAYVIELVKAHIDREEPVGGDRFWQALAEEALANHLWQHAEFPPDGALHIEDLTVSLRRWVDAVQGAWK